MLSEILSYFNFINSESITTTQPHEVSLSLNEFKEMVQADMPYQEGNGKKPIWQTLIAEHFPYFRWIKGNSDFALAAIYHGDNKQVLRSLLSTSNAVLKREHHENVLAYVVSNGKEHIGELIRSHIHVNYPASNKPSR